MPIERLSFTTSVGITPIHYALVQFHDTNRADAELRALGIVSGIIAFVGGLVAGVAI